MARSVAVRPIPRAVRIAAFGLLAAIAITPASAQNAGPDTPSQRAAMLPPPGSAYRLNDRALGLGYDVYIGGIYAFHFDATLSVDDRSYDVVLRGGTTGFIGRMFSWQADLRSAGGLASAKPVPEGLAAATFESAATWRGTPHRTTLRFHGDGRYDVALEPPEDAENVRADGAPPELLPTGTLDPVAASIAALAGSARDGTCSRQETVFDGKRYYQLIVRDGDGENAAPQNHLSA
ncbi:MAG TPA: DUF3108 domain-containing protein, partial [Alphaproteobacteria bacterium]|nr:DUF3108 domain-containing protein [Alphaproteobacteria bacterium]